MERMKSFMPGVPATIAMAVVMVALVVLNLVVSGPHLVGFAGSPPDSESFDYFWGRYRGWPLHFQQTELHQVYPAKHADVVAGGGKSPFVVPMREGRELSFHDLTWPRYYPILHPWVWPSVAFVIDVVVALLVSAIVGLVTRRLVALSGRR